jgi:hypothetical protein
MCRRYSTLCYRGSHERELKSYRNPRRTTRGQAVSGASVSCSSPSTLDLVSHSSAHVLGYRSSGFGAVFSLAPPLPGYSSPPRSTGMPPLAALARLASSSSNSYAPLPSWFGTAPASPILSRTVKEGRPRWRRSWLITAFPALALLVLLLSRWRGGDEVQIKQGPMELLREVAEACKTNEVLQGRKEASFWVAEVGATRQLIRYISQAYGSQTNSFPLILQI